MSEKTLAITFNLTSHGNTTASVTPAPAAHLWARGRARTRTRVLNRPRLRCGSQRHVKALPWTFVAACKAILLIAVLTISGCSGKSLQSVKDRFENPRSQAVGIESTEPISDYWLRKYNIAAQSELARVWRFGRQVGWKNRYNKVLKAVLKYDGNNADYFASEVNDEFVRMGREVKFSKVTKIFRDHGVIINWRYSDYRNGDFLWKLGPLYQLPQQVSDVLNDLYPPEKFTTPVLETVTTDSISANLQVADLAFLAPASIRKSSAQLGWNAEDAITAVAAHEAAHHVNEQVLSNMGYTRTPYYRTHLSAMSDALSDIDFYHENEVEEFLADAVAIQTSANATHPEQVIGLVASRVLQQKDAFELVKRRGTSVRRRPHFASAEFIYKLFEKEETRRGYTKESAVTIAKLRQQGKTTTTWRKEHWLPYLDTMLTDDFIKSIRLSYRDAFMRIREVLRI